ncbi:MAG: hypothetical protein QG653_445 [Patescibacteria group bacterium]|nr:hypothetical protein [Patescibacteria group bacterium]
MPFASSHTRTSADQVAWENTIAEARKIWKAHLPWYAKNEVLALAITAFISFFTMISAAVFARHAGLAKTPDEFLIVLFAMIVGFIGMTVLLMVPITIAQSRARRRFQQEHKTESYILDIEEGRM